MINRMSEILTNVNGKNCKMPYFLTMLESAQKEVPVNNAFFKFLVGFVILVAVLRWGSDDAALLGSSTEVSQSK